METKRVTLMGIPVLVVGEGSDEWGCGKCVFVNVTHGCPTNAQALAAGTSSCVSGEHYYIHAPETTEDRAERLALDYHAELSKLGLTEHSHVLRILQSELGKRRTAALFKPK